MWHGSVEVDGGLASGKLRTRQKTFIDLSKLAQTFNRIPQSLLGCPKNVLVSAFILLLHKCISISNLFVTAHTQQ